MAVQVWAHRGASGYAPENTMKAFRLAHRLGADACENDVHLTRDGAIVVIHDHDVSRVSAGQGKVEEMTLAELKALDVGEGERIPTLEECLAFFDASGMKLNIEIKTGEEIYDPALVEGVGKAVRKFGLSSRIIISSFYHKSLADMKSLFPEIDTAVLHGPEIREPGAYAAALGARYSHPHYACVNKAFMEECAKHGVLVNPWTVDGELDLVRMKDLGVNMVITDFPDRALRCLA